MACSKLEAMATYLVKQACGNDKLACVYIVKPQHNLLCADKADLSKQFREFAILQAGCEFS